MVKQNEKIVLECKAVPATKRYLKYRLPDELFEDEEPDVMFSGKHVYVRKGDEGDKVKQVVVVLQSGERT